MILFISMLYVALYFHLIPFIHTVLIKCPTFQSLRLRVGFCQGNFNSDNCLVGGRTMDYGPFGWIDRYNPLFAKWTGSGEHYGFLNQPQAAIANFHTLLTSVIRICSGFFCLVLSSIWFGNCFENCVAMSFPGRSSVGRRC